MICYCSGLISKDYTPCFTYPSFQKVKPYFNKNLKVKELIKENQDILK